MPVKTTVEIKCPNCGLLNKNQDYCISCKIPISYQAKRKEEDKKIRLAKKNKPKDKYDKLFEHLKTHPIFIVRWFYYIVYSIAFVFYMIAAFFAFIVAFFNG
ncbi:MAG: hypothetical protein N4A45_00810 [Flavobacteriales bacterium]|jgi:predicted RNA-binding Zn-ribbon protein involved in translation (DUF1610 family)|nr:hypothetical protein [Flavobacteriales bacterium]